MHKKFLIAGIAASIFIFVFEFLVHGVALMGMYESTESLWRPFSEMESLWWFSMLVQLATAFAMACYMSKRSIFGAEAGACFGSMIGVFMGIMQLGTFVFLPLAMTLPLMWSVIVWIKMIAVGAIVGYFYSK